MPKEMPIELPEDEKAASIAYKAGVVGKRVTSGKGRTLVNVVFALMLAFFAFGMLGSCVTGSSEPTLEASDSGERTVTYRISCSAPSASVTYSRGANNTEQKSGAAVPNEVSFTAQPGEFLYVSAQNEGESGDIQVSIEVDGQTISSANSSGGYTIATASETCP